MSAPHLPKVAGIDPAVTASPHTPAPTAPTPARSTPAQAPPPAASSVIQDRLAGMVSDLTTLHELTERLARSVDLDSSLREFLRAGAALVGARRGLVVLEPSDGLGPTTTIGLGLGHADLGHIETVPRSATSYGRILDGLPDAHGGSEVLPEPGEAPGTGGFGVPVDPRHREVAARLGYAASYALPLTAEATGRLGAAVWLYDEQAEPGERQRDLAGLYVRHAAEHLARMVEVERSRSRLAIVTEELLPSRLPRIPGVQLAARHHTGPRGGGDWYDALPLPEGPWVSPWAPSPAPVRAPSPRWVACGPPCARTPSWRRGPRRGPLRPGAVAAADRTRALGHRALRLLRTGRPEDHPGRRGAHPAAAHRRAADRVRGDLALRAARDAGLLGGAERGDRTGSRRNGAALHGRTAAAHRRPDGPRVRPAARGGAGVPRAAREDPAAICDHILRTVLPEGEATPVQGEDATEDIVLLAARFD